MLVPSLLLITILVGPALSSPARVIKQRVPKFKNFPIVGLKKTVTEDAEATLAASLEEHPRDAREAVVKTVSGEPDLDNLFVEEAVYLTPADRDQRALEQLDQDHEESFDAVFFDEDLENDDNERTERDGGHHHAPSHRASRRGQRGGRQNLRSQPLVEPDYDYQEAPVRRQEQRGGRQTGGTGVALGVLSNPPSSDGNYNFNFSNDDGSSRQEVGAPDAIRGSYSFVTPEGEQVSVEYHADETGFHATGSHVPQAPPMPPHVQRLLDHLAKVNGLNRL